MADRPSAGFEREADLQGALASPEVLGAALDEIGFGGFDRVLARREVPVGGCIPDLVVVGFAGEPCLDVWPRRRTYRHAYVVSMLRRHGRLRPETIAAKAFAPLDRIRPVLDDLLASGAICQAESGAVSLSPSLAESDAEVVAVEAKLRRWREALEQASSYATFANRVLVAMDAAGAPSTPEALAAFRERGVGLLTVRSGTVECLVPPRRSSRRADPQWDYLVSSAAAPGPQTLWLKR
ncbi:MAG: hypothetical protein OZ948_17815 [Deltaproteobacteria bacterium]|nr:hypothetical protein [Deltaproteobacteria bacterium]